MMHFKNHKSLFENSLIIFFRKKYFLLPFALSVFALQKYIEGLNKKIFSLFRLNYPSIHFPSLHYGKHSGRTDWSRNLRIWKFRISSKHGFTLIEVMLAMMIMGLTFSPIFILFGMVLQRVNRSSRNYEALLLCKNFLYEARQKQEAEAQTFSLEKKEADFGGTLTYSLDKGVDQRSSLASVQGLHREIVTISWQEAAEKKQEQLVTFVYKKPEQKKS